MCVHMCCSALCAPTCFTAIVSPVFTFSAWYTLPEEPFPSRRPLIQVNSTCFRADRRITSAAHVPFSRVRPMTLQSFSLVSRFYGNIHL